MKKINVSKEKLRKLYIVDKLSTRSIAQILKCDQGVILRRLKEYKIKIRQPCKEIKISKEKLNRLYWRKGLSTYKIAKIYSCDNKTIYRKLRLGNIRTRPKKKVEIPKKELHHLYHIRKWPLSKIAKKFSCDKVTVFDKMKKYEIPSRTISQAKTIYQKKDFSGNLTEKAYLIGFRLGDLNVYGDYCSICVQGSTTKIEQKELIERLFKKYTKVEFKVNKDQKLRAQIRLNKSFYFLLPKKDTIKKWILKNKKYFSAFLAGYIDAEGNIGIYCNKGRVRIRSYDKNLLYLAHRKLKELGIYSICRLEAPAKKFKLKKDFWCLSINRKKDILRLNNLVGVYLKHARRKDALLCIIKKYNNIYK